MASDSLPDLGQIIADQTSQEGVTQTAIDNLILVRLSAPMVRTPVVYGPSICVVAQGAKHAHLGGRTLVYDRNHYLICSLTLPVDSEIPEASAEAPFLGLVLKVDLHLVGQVLMEMEDYMRWPEGTEPSIKSGPIDEQLRRTMARLLFTANHPMDRKILAPGLMREAIYTVLKGPIGYVLRDCVVRDSSAHRVAKVVRFLEENYQRALDVEEIARHANMSPSALHHHFKQATTMSPIQFVKKLRLHRARAMLLSGHGAGEAAFAVGYGSPSQFSREFRRLFGMPPNQVRASAAMA